MDTIDSIFPSKGEISKNLSLYKTTLHVLEKIITAMEDENSANNNWYIYSEKIGRKVLNQGYSLWHILSEEVYHIKNEKEILFVDISTIFTLLRLQLETYAVFYLLFCHKSSVDEKRLRFALWQIDGLRTRKNFSKPDNDEELIKKLKEEERYIETLIKDIRVNNYFKGLDTITQEHLVNYSNWRFTESSLKNKDKRKWKISIDRMIMNTGIKESYFEDIYSFNSTHVHTGYFGVAQIDGTSLESKIIVEDLAVQQAALIASFFIQDFCVLYDTTRKIFESLNKHEQDTINWFNKHGRN